jgi:Carboxypeptidase regulatory-like domain
MITRRWLALVTSLVVMLGGNSFSQQRTTASIQGVVIRSEGEPLSKVMIELRYSDATGPDDPVLATTQTDGDGKFYLPGVAPGKYRIVAWAQGYVRTIHPQTLALAAGLGVSDVRIAMTAAGWVSGRITEKGQPVALADVVAFRPIYIEGQLAFAPVLADRTNDLGEYNLFWLPPGRYYIVAVLWDTASAVGFFVNPDGSDINPFWAQRMESKAVFMRTLGTSIGDNEAHVPFYYPGTPDPQGARIVEVRPGAHLTGIDVDAAPMLTRRVTGTVTGLPAATAGGQPPRANVNLRPLGPSLNTNVAQTPTVQSDPVGNFEIPRAISGRYMLIAVAGNLTARIPLEIRDRDVSGVVVPLGTGIRISGRVVFERQNAASPDPGMANLRVALRTDPLLPGAPAFNVTPGPDGSFTIPAPPANPAAQAAAPPVGEYRVLVPPILIAPVPPDGNSPTVPAALQNAYVKSITFGGNDVLNDRLRLQSQTDDQLLIVIGTKPASLDGRVVNDQQQPASGATVVLVHDDGLRYHVNEKFTSTDLAGQFRFENVPPGNYKLFAWEAIDKGAWNDPGLMQEFERYARPIRIEEGGKISVELSAIR